MSVLMFHSVGCENENWYRKWLSVSLDHFENLCKFLKKENYHTEFLDNWYDSNHINTPSKQVFLTFDDGYLDNWVYAYPILKKYGLKATIFVNPDFIDPSTKERDNLEKVWNGNINFDDLAPLGFLNWSELKKMESSGCFDVQSHSMTHNFYFKSNVINDFYTGQPEYDWMAWISNPEKKPYYITENQSSLIEFGTPVFDFGRALGLRRYFPDNRIVEYSNDFFSRNNEMVNQKEILEILNNKLKLLPGEYESNEEMERRYRFELFESKRIIEENLNKTVYYLCWPGGGYNEFSIKLSIEAGYKASTGVTTYESSPPHYKRISRIPMSSFISTAKGNYYINDSKHLIKVFKSFNGNFFYRNLNRAKKLNKLIFERVKI